jgi:lysophospholipase L1-like esterase
MKPREAAANLFASVICLGALLLVSEAAIRIYLHWSLVYDIEMSRYAMDVKVQSPNPLIGHVHRPNAQADLMGVAVTIDSDGFRDREYPVERNASRRIIFLGDSLTFGWGVEKSKTFKEILEAKLSESKPTEIINFGTGNYNTEQEANLFLEKGLKYKPDAVVVFYFINDAEPTPHESDWKYLGRSRIVTFFWSRLKTALTLLRPDMEFRQYYSGLYADQDPGWIAAQRAFLELRDVCERNGISLRVVLLPDLHVLENYPFAAEHLKVMTFLRDNGIAARDLAPFFAAERDPARLWVASDDTHPNEIAHAMIAKYTLDFLMEGINGRLAGSAN